MNEGEARKALCDQCGVNMCKPMRVGRRDFVRICKSCFNKLPKENQEKLMKEHKLAYA